MISRRKHSIFSAGLPATPPERAFSLLELLVVVALMVIAMSLTMPPVVGVQRSYHLAKAATQIKDNLQLARQLAMARNESIVASFCKAKDEFGKASYNVLVLSRELPDGTLASISKPVRLTGGIGISGDIRWSSIMTDSLSGTSVFQNTKLPCQQIRFKASGATDLASTPSWYLTLFYNPDSTVLPANFVTLAIDPVTGRIVWSQP
jgi:uncharacterized protein (TIGR02596 family)